ncbi:MAG: glycosyltransferase family 2 protein, partial [Patescibacteria group bacterium]
AGQRELNRFVMEDFDRSEVRDVDWLQGSCMMARSRAVQEVGVMDERFFMYFEDVDWCRRFWEAGWRVSYVPEGQLSHFHQRSSEKGSLLGILFNWATREHIKSAIKYFLKYRGKKLPR